MDLTIRFAGPAGGGIQTTADILGKIATRAGMYAHCYVDAESRIRGGLNFSHLRVSDRPAAGVLGRTDILVAQSPKALEVLSPGLASDAVVLSLVDADVRNAAPLRLAALAHQAGSEKTAGTVALGVLTQWLGLAFEQLEAALRETFGDKGDMLVSNLTAAELGAKAGASWRPGFLDNLPAPQGSSGRLWLSGAEAIALGAVAAGVSFCAGYPMSPATGVLTALAAFGADAGVHVEQAEDEIAAINMVAGASFAGARAMTATSGGGYDLMTEGVSLLGMIEAPAVIALAQRPGPATGLPTRVAQGDLNLARHAGHGFFPRIILAPQSIADAFEVTAQAFDLAERYQVPVFVMTDQHLNDSRVTCEAPSLEGLPKNRWFLTPAALEGAPSYRRYAWSDDGISPMAMPGKSRHLVYADSDEHTDEGHITESAEVADRMARKRLAKLDTVRRAAWPCAAPDIEGRTIVVSWGSTYETVREALGRGQAASPMSHLHLRWLWPAGDAWADAIRKASRVVTVEASVGCELDALLRETALRAADRIITRRDGRPFEVEELVRALSEEAHP